MKQPLYFLTLAFCVALTISSHQKAEAAGTVGNGTAASCTEAALDTALVGGGTVTFNCGSSPHTIVVKEKVLSANTVIDGRSVVTLSGNGTNRIFSTDSLVQLTLKNLTIANGFSTENGGGVYSGYRGKLVVLNCTFNNNKSTMPGEAGGGAIYSKSESTIIIDKSTFTGNQASLGGAIYDLLSDLTVTNSTFTGNSAGIVAPGGAGGAIYNDGANGNLGKIILRNNTFTNNIATNQGGAFFNQLYNSNTTTIENNTFSGNNVTGTGDKGFGGAIFVVGGTTTAPNYTAGTNSTIFVVRNTTFSNNISANQGGGLWTGNDVSAEVSNTTFSGNRAVTPDAKGGLGGAIMRTSGKMTLNNVTIANNYAGFMGAGIFGSSPDITLKNTIIANNKADNGGNTWNIKQNCSDEMTNGGNNIQFPAKNPNDPTDKNCAVGITIVEPMLGALSATGGLTQTLPLLAGSPAINTGNNATCLATDQRGVARPQGGVCDIGAFEAK
ncbi:right-handed parallel beta-helix repeat-containing protein [Coleofasciculus sp. FACHB-SPT9]|uniref:right-handed parallel beta-helix repeat-containing protein n=1 Tax=Cyanophyceae TaxID=3028117 RepID=UPI001681DE1B|nr:right-handed parallel beta-helix repeat-containing protein [Coleofasciculus sp. FACHB-SPT9]MBD1890185.1 right-handed parallel beta-helix repeat-containing protein [Coleofasciculus sp. FACHB-SPT9]